MLRSDVETYQDVNGVRTTDTGAIGGARNASALIADGSEGALFADLGIEAEGGTDQVYFGTAWKFIKTGATGSLLVPVAYNRAGAKRNASAGIVNARSTSPLDTGTVRVTGKEEAAQTGWDQDDVVLNGTSDVSGDQFFDEETIVRGEYLVGGLPQKPIGNVSLDVDGAIFMVIYGTGTPAGTDAGRGNIMASSESRLAIATAINTELTWSGTNNRRTAPNGNVSDFAYAYRWTGDDDSHPVGSTMVATNGLNFVVELTLYAGIYRPVAGYLVIDIALNGDAG